jgi:hypothetical protein
MAADGVSRQYSYRNQYERMLLQWLYFKTPWREKIKISLSFIKQVWLHWRKGQ